jgi:hypothetical protein
MVENLIHPEGAPCRFAPELPFPVYAYVPGRHPHPSRTGFARTVDCGDLNTTHRYALDLFNYGYYWEAHEAWETLWHAYGRHSLEGRLIHGLIALAAAGVKVREGNALGVVHHVRRAAAIFRDLSAERLVMLGLAVDALTAFAEEIAVEPPCRPAEKGAPPEIVFTPLMLV